MGKYISKDNLVAEIESKKKYAQTLGDNAINGSMQQFYDGMKQCCVDILSFLDTLEVKEVNEVPANVIVNQFGNKYISSWSGLKEYDNFQVNEEIKILIPSK